MNATNTLATHEREQPALNSFVCEGMASLRPEFGGDAIRLQTSFGPGWVVRSCDAIPAEMRANAFAAQCRDFSYYEVIEATLGGQFDFRYFVLQEAASGQWAIQPFFFVDQDTLAGLPGALRAAAAFIRKLWPRFLKLRMMMVGSAAGPGQLDHSSPWLVPALREAIDLYRPQALSSIILFKDFPSIYRKQLEHLSRHGYQRAPSMPAATLKIDFATFEEYMMSRLSKVFRKNLRRKLRVFDGAAPVEMEVIRDASEFSEELHALYLQTHLRSEFRFESLTKEYLARIGQRMPERVRYFVWRQNGAIIAFNLCLIHGETLYDLDMGLDYSVALELHLYFVTWRDVIEWCLQNGIKTYHTGPLNYDPKAHLRLSLAPQDLYARHRSAFLNPLFRLAIKYLEPTRYDPMLKKFPNAHEL